MSSALLGLASQVLSRQTASVTGGDQDNFPDNEQEQQQGVDFANQALSRQTASVTGGAQYNSPDNRRQQQQGVFDPQAVLSHAGDVDQDSQGYITNAIQHVHDNADQHQQQVDDGNLNQYSTMITSAVSSFQQSGGSVGSLLTSGLGQNGGNQLMGHVLRQAGNAANQMGLSDQAKQNLMNGAAMTFTKLAAQGSLSGFVGGANSGGLGSLVSAGGSLLANRFGQQ